MRIGRNRARSLIVAALPALVACATGIDDGMDTSATAGDGGVPLRHDGGVTPTSAGDDDASPTPPATGDDAAAPSSGGDSSAPADDGSIADSAPPPPAIDATPPPAVDAGPTTKCADPTTPASCNAGCTTHTCSANGCYNGYLCVLATSKCVAPGSASCL